MKTVRKLVDQSTGHEWRGTATQLMEAGEYIAGQYLAVSAKALGKRLGELDRLLLENDGIVHMTESNGNGGKRHIYRYSTSVHIQEAEEQQEIPFPT